MKVSLTAKEYSEFYPILSISKDNIIISKTGDITVGFEFKLPPIFTNSESDYDEMQNCLLSALKLLPDNTVVHKQDRFIKTSYCHKENLPTEGFLSKAYAHHFTGREYLKHTCYLFISKLEKGRATAYSLSSILTRSSIILNKVAEEKIYEFLASVNSFAGMINNSRKLELRQLLKDEYLDDPISGAGLLTQYRNLSLSSTTEYQTVELTPAMYKVGDKKLISHTICESDYLPQQFDSIARVEEYSTTASSVNLSIGAYLGWRLPIEHITNQYILLTNQATLRANLAQKSNYLKSLAKTSRSNQVNSDAINECLINVAKTGSDIIRTHINVLSWSSDLEQEAENKNKINSAIANMGIKPVYNTFDTPVLYWGGIPGNAGDVGIESYMTLSLSSAVGMMSFEGVAKEMNCHTTTFSDRLSGIPLNIDLAEHAHFKENLIENYNKFILGPSGSGKSFTTNHYLRQSYDLGGHVFVIDIGNSYKGLCQIIQEETAGLDGLYYSYNVENPLSFNPFYSEKKEYNPEKKTFLRSLICTLWKGVDNDVTPAELSIISETVSLFIEKIQQSSAVMNFNDYYDFVKNDYIQSREVREKDFDFVTFLLVLKKFYRGGEHAHLLNSQEQLDLTSKRFIVFEIDNIKGDTVIFPILTMLMIDIFVTKMYAIPQKKTMLIEEAWKAIANRQMGEYILYLWKTARKHCAEAIVVTQEIDDIISSPIVKEAIISNSAIKILMDMKNFKNKFVKITEFLSLSEEDKAQILSINRNNHPSRRYKEAFISIGSTWNGVYAIEVSPEEGCAYNTDKHKKLELEALTAKTGSIIEAINQLTNKK